MTNAKSPWAFGLVRNGKVVGVELTLACARHWVDVDIVPLGPLPDSEQFKALLGENLERECCGTFFRTPHRSTCSKHRGKK